MKRLLLLVLLAVAVTPSVLSGHGGIDLSLGPFAGFCTVLIGTYLNSGALGRAYVIVPVVLGMGLVLPAVSAASMASADRDQSGIASGVVNASPSSDGKYPNAGPLMLALSGADARASSGTSLVCKIACA